MNIKKKIGRKLNGLIRRTQWFNEELFPDCRKFWAYRTFNTDVINLGSTSGYYAFDYEGISSVKCGNFALRHNPLSGDQAILKNYFGYLNPKESHVIISLCVFSSLAGSYDFMEDRFYTLLSPVSIPHFSYRRQQQVKSWAGSPIKKFPLWSIYSELKNLLRGKKCKVMSETEMEKNAQSWIKGWLHEFSVQDFSQPLSLMNKDGLKDASDILNEMISFCKERNITPTFVLPPMYHTLAEKFDAQARKVLLYDLIDTIEDKSVTFLNYMDDGRFSHDPSMFQDSFLLNKSGAKKFTSIVLKDIGVIKA